MAAKAKSAAAPSIPSKAGNPFAKIKQSSKAPGKLDHVVPDDPAIRTAVDAYKKVAGEIKRLEGEKAAQAGLISRFGREHFAQRQMRNRGENFVLDGFESTVTYVYANYGTGLSAEDYEKFAHDHGKPTAEALLELKIAGVKFRKETLDEPGVMDQVVAALQTLPAELLERLFTEATFGPVEGVFEKARAHAASAREYQQIMDGLKVNNYPKT